VDENLTAKVAHLGLAKMLPAEPNEGDNHVTTEVVGTLDYLDPEYAYTGQLSVKSDVYSLGIVLLQLITRRRALNCDYFEFGYINDLVKDALESGGIRRLKEELMDPLLRDSVLVGFERFLRLALTCARKQGSQRPSMREVMKELESILDMDMEPTAWKQKKYFCITCYILFNHTVYSREFLVTTVHDKIIKSLLSVHVKHFPEEDLMHEWL
jgi:serine/threonine protein kinase